MNVNNVQAPASPAVRVRARLASSSLPTAFDPSELRLAITYVAPAELKPPRRALRNYSKLAKERLKRSIRDFGFLIAVVTDTSGRIVVGHRRWLAAVEMGLGLIPVVEITHLTEQQLRTFTILDNKLCEDSEWDLDALRIEFEELTCTGNFNFEDTGFSTAEFDNLFIGMSGKDQKAAESEDEIPAVAVNAVTRRGDVWIMGQHRLLCGNSLEVHSFEVLLGDERAQMVFSDSPYNLPAKTISGKGKHCHRDFEVASGEMSIQEFTDFLHTSFDLVARFSVDGSIHFQCMDHRHLREMLDAGYRAYSELKNLVVWKKHSAGMGSFYRSQHELVFVWKSGSAAHINNFGLGATGRHRSNVWDYRGNAGFHSERDDELASHATVKPWPMVADAIRDCSKPGGIILDPFGGSGTTLIAAERTRRRARLIELDPLYCDVTVRRWEKLTGQEATLSATGETFATLEATRAAEAEAPGDGKEAA
jgi:DNA modification methylase